MLLQIFCISLVSAVLVGGQDCGLCGTNVAVSPQAACKYRIPAMRTNCDDPMAPKRRKRMTDPDCMDREGERCCIGTLQNHQCSVGCGGCTNCDVKKQPVCYRVEKFTYTQSVPYQTRCGPWWGRKCTRYRIETRVGTRQGKPYCCVTYEYVNGQCVKK